LIGFALMATSGILPMMNKNKTDDAPLDQPPPETTTTTQSY